MSFPIEGKASVVRQVVGKAKAQEEVLVVPWLVGCNASQLVSFL